MDEFPTISKTRKLSPAQDFELLREEGLKHVQGLASELWTDYNTHDPGITILEALCYAITELGYRTGFDIRNLLADENGRIDRDQTFFSAKSILTSAPLTIEDYRKLLVDIVGVKNAFLYPYRDEELMLTGEPDQEVPIYAHCKKDKLVYDVTEHPISLRGLYRVVLDLDQLDEFGELNDGSLTWQFAVANLLNIKVEISLPEWDVVDTEFIAGADPLTIAGVNVQLDDRRWTVSFNIENAGAARPFEFTAIVPGKAVPPEVIPEITAQFSDIGHLREIFVVYQKKLKLVLSILMEAKGRLHANRSLAEDFVDIKTICTQNIAFCADIEVTADVDIEEVYAKILFAIENYFNPEVRFYSLAELLNEGISTDVIFEGPVLAHGFIKTDEIRNAQVRRKIYVSDLINFIMDIEGVLSVKDVLLTKYKSNGKPELPSERWCMEINDGCKPVLDLLRSKATFYKGKLPFKPTLDETHDTVKYLHGLESRNKLKGTAQDLETIKGEYRDLADYASIQFEFPITYGIGNSGLPDQSSNERKSQARQLKGYLMFYDQVLANFFSQLRHAPELFSLNPAVNQTYFGKYIDDIPGMEEIYSNPTNLRAIFSKPTAADPQEVREGRALLLENSERFFDRRHRFLDHLIGRFSESFNEYVLMLYRYKSADEFQDIGDQQLVNDKIRFLQDYPVISQQRGQAFNYILPSWNSGNVSGFEKRIARLSGISDFNRRFLFCLRNLEVQKTTADPPKYFFRVIDESGNALLQSFQEYDSYDEVSDILKKLADVVGDVTFYQDEDISPSQFSFEVWDAADTPLAESGMMFPDAASRDAAIVQVAAAMNKDCPPEGMHLVEHILLRPRFSPPVIAGMSPEDVYQMFHVCLNEECDFCGEEDPYSFRISLILPYRHERFQNPEFRYYFENMVRTEAPAHCLLKICWVNNTMMNEFERAYKKWLEALADYESDLIHKQPKMDPLREASNTLIDILNRLHSEHPQAKLHDCETGLTNPVLLDNTVLGTHKIKSV